MDDIPADQLEVYTQFGIAAEMAQTLEVDAGNVALACLAMFIDTDKITPEQTEWCRCLSDSLDRQTLGKLLRSLKNLVKLGDDILEVVDSALIARNYLMHRFFPFHNFALFGVEGRKEMIRELGEIQNKLCRAHWFLIAMCDGLHEIRLQIKPSGRKMDRQQIAQDMRERGERITLSSDKGLS
jgi:hypothetical protein